MNKKFMVFVIILILTLSTFSVVYAEEQKPTRSFWGTLWDTGKNLVSRGVDKLMESNIPLPIPTPVGFIPIKVKDAVNVGKAVFNAVKPKTVAEAAEPKKTEPQKLPTTPPPETTADTEPEVGDKKMISGVEYEYVGYETGWLPTGGGIETTEGGKIPITSKDLPPDAKTGDTTDVGGVPYIFEKDTGWRQVSPEDTNKVDGVDYIYEEETGWREVQDGETLESGGTTYTYEKDAEGWTYRDEDGKLKATYTDEDGGWRSAYKDEDGKWKDEETNEEIKVEGEVKESPQLPKTEEPPQKTTSTIAELPEGAYYYGGGGLFGLGEGTKVYAKEFVKRDEEGNMYTERKYYAQNKDGTYSEIEYREDPDGSGWFYKDTNNKVEGTIDAPPPEEGLSLKEREDVVYKLTNLLLQKTLGKFADDKISEKCKADWESSEPESDTPISTDGGLYDTEEGACPDSDDTLVTAQVYTSAIGPPYSYDLSYTITACKERVAYTFYFRDPIRETVDSGDVLLGDSVSKSKSITSKTKFKEACMKVSDTTVGDNGEFCFTLATS